MVLLFLYPPKGFRWCYRTLKYTSNDGSRHGTVPGVPDVPYFLSKTSGRSECKVEVTDEKIAEVET